MKSPPFGFPRFPSEETIIAQPLHKEDFDNEKAYKEKIDQLQKVLSKVKDVLNELDDLFHSKEENAEKQRAKYKSLDDILKKAKVTKEDYYEALRTSKTGKIIILKRTVNELWVNNYNPEWIQAWNGNMDIQLCLDFYAIVTYITGLAT